MLWLPRRLPRPLAVELLLTGRPMTAAEACERGLINQAVPADQLMPAARALAAQIIRSAPLAVAAVLEVLDATEAGSVPDGFAALRSGGLAAVRSDARVRGRNRGAGRVRRAAPAGLEGPLTSLRTRKGRWAPDRAGRAVTPRPGRAGGDRRPGSGCP